MAPANSDGCSAVNAYLVLKDAQAAIDFYAKAFGGEGTCLFAPDGKSVMHAEVRIGEATVMLSEENPQWQTKSAETLGESPVSLHLCVDDADAWFERAVAAGCTVVAPPADMFWGDRYGKVLDPFGYQWGIATKIEDVPPDEMQDRANAWFAQMSADRGGDN